MMDLLDGYRVIRHGKPTKVKAKPASLPKSGKALNTWLRKATHAEHKRLGNCTKTNRLFPQGYGVADWPMVTTTFTDTGEVSIDYAGDPIYSKELINGYVAEFCRLNHLKVA